MRAVVPILLSLCLFASAQDEKPKPTLAETLEREKAGELWNAAGSEFAMLKRD